MKTKNVNSLPQNISSEQNIISEQSNAHEEFVHTLKRETELFHTLVAHEKILQRSILKRNYEKLESTIGELNNTAKDIEALEKKREYLLRTIAQGLNIPHASTNSSTNSSVNSSTKSSSNEASRRALQERNIIFSQILRKTAITERANLSTAYRQFKIAVFKARSIGNGILAFTSTKLESMAELLYEAHPEQKASTYTACGRKKSLGVPVLLDTSL